MHSHLCISSSMAAPTRSAAPKTLPTTMPATAPAGKAELLLEAAWCVLVGVAVCVSGVSGRSVTRLPFTPQPEKDSRTMSCGLACWTWLVAGAGEGAGMAVAR